MYNWVYTGWRHTFEYEIYEEERKRNFASFAALDLKATTSLELKKQHESSVLIKVGRAPNKKVCFLI